MIGYLRGTVSHLFADYCFLDVQGVGYRVFIPYSTRQKLSAGNSAMLFTYLHVREDALLLYGFSSQEEYDLFLQLLSVSGIGPKVALSIMSAASPQEFRRAVSQKNIALLTRLPGIGKKTAERIIVELKDKMNQELDASDNPESFIQNGTGHDNGRQEALMALMALGYSQAELMPVIRKVTDGTESAEEIIKRVLKEFGRR
ncbi:bacterial dna recombination protein ruva [Lucifera butyrica]|uniref:Holliday junction branch migration complex subunit RuvA n=1 Tax=Lucifera butyrica TaxID=1351585 RepID=A0A498R5F7_9FIRM|nr:Holliday junction branch migration protein RuvA [Lucifera butyrica]VBB06060.1 bacterial dna recombination protein ruva [Lucifera butyrica]